MSVPDLPRDKNPYRTSGTRGGRGLFNWEDVKKDKYRHNYLGNSLKARVGKRAEQHDAFWWTRKPGETDAASAAKARRAELEEVKRRDDAIMAQALGLAPSDRGGASNEHLLREEDVSFMTSRGMTERGDRCAERISGLGATPKRSSASASAYCPPGDERKSKSKKKDKKKKKKKSKEKKKKKKKKSRSRSDSTEGDPSPKRSKRE